LDKEIKLPRVIECLPSGDNFPVYVLARYLHVHRQHVLNLIDSGEIKCAIDIRGPGASRSTIRVPRWAVEEFLKSREIIVVGKTAPN
jgi:hypothetical protein